MSDYGRKNNLNIGKVICNDYDDDDDGIIPFVDSDKSDEIDGRGSLLVDMKGHRKERNNFGTEIIGNDPNNTDKIIDVDRQQLPSDRQQLSTDRQQFPSDRQQLSTDREKLSTDRQQLSTDQQNFPTDQQNFSTDRQNSSIDRENLSISIDPESPPGLLVNISSTPTSYGLRRNSISLPTGLNTLDLERLQNKMSNISTISSQPDSITEDNNLQNTADSSKECNETDEEEEESKPIYPYSFRSKRRLSVAPLPAIKLNDKDMLSNDYDAHSVLSNQNSITSINSLASLLKEKMQAFPSMIRRKKKETKDYKIKIFVAILFFIIVFLVGYSYVMYHQKVLTRSYFEKAKFSKAERLLRIFDDKEEEVIRGYLGRTIETNTPFHCLDEDTLNDGSVCLEWNGVARLYMNFQNHDVFRCYSIKWQALGEGIYPTDCYDLSKGGSQWFGGGITKHADWPLNSANFKFAPFISGDAKVHQFGNAVKRYFINSRGFAIQVDDKTPLHLSVNRTADRFCMRAKNDDFAFVNRLTPLPELSYKICTAEDMRSLHMLMTQQSLWDGLKEEDLKILHSLLEEPVWRVPLINGTFLNETSIYNTSEEIIATGFMRLGHILVNEFWQKNIGDFSVDNERFPTLKTSIDVLHRRGFRIVLTVQPFISTDSPNFKDAVEKKLLIYERHSERSIPALTRYKNSSSAGVLDITNNASIPWLISKLKAVVNEYQIDSFYLDLGTSYNIPHYYQCRKTLDNPDVYAKVFTSSLDNLIGYIGVSTATVVPKPPAFLSLPPVNSSWDGLRTLVISVLNYGILGYPFILPGPVGGDYFLLGDAPKMISFYSLGRPPLPSQELYIRWLQVVTFLPAMQFNHLPSEYKSDYVTEIVKELITIRQKTVIPLLKKYLSESMNEGLPLVRPLWMLDPHDPACLIVNDEFSVGEELIVAPILEESVSTREVYLPQGVWKDGVDGSLRKGSRWIHNYHVPKEKIAYFVKMPDNTRF